MARVDRAAETECNAKADSLSIRQKRRAARLSQKFAFASSGAELIHSIGHNTHETNRNHDVETNVRISSLQQPLSATTKSSSLTVLSQ